MGPLTRRAAASPTSVRWRGSVPEPRASARFSWNREATFSSATSWSRTKSWARSPTTSKGCERRLRFSRCGQRNELSEGIKQRRRPTKDIVTEAAAAALYRNEFWEKEYPRVQILTVEEVLAGKRPQMPAQQAPFAKGPLEREAAKTERML